VDELEIRMREVLLQLALTSNGRTSSFNSSGGSQHDYTPTLGAGDAPHLHFAKLWDAAQDDGRRRTILRDAKDVLKTLRQSRGDRTRVESEKELFTRIVNRGEGIGAQELATRMRCGVTLVRKARAEEGRETEYGRAPRNGHELAPAERAAEVRRLAETGMNARQVALALSLPYNTVRRDLGRMD
jgi:hypothetical protein